VASQDPLLQAESAATLIKAILEKLVSFAASHRLFGGMEVEHILNDLASDACLRIRDGKVWFRSREELFAYLYRALGYRSISRNRESRRVSPATELETLHDPTNPGPVELEQCVQFLDALGANLGHSEATVLNAIILGYRPQEIRNKLKLGENAYRVLVTSLRQKVKAMRPGAPPPAIGRPSGEEGPPPPDLGEPSQSLGELLREAVMGFLSAAYDAPSAHSTP
jgi:DNA-directed RNA polymerase specialized sigma24 family protein